MDFLPHRVDNSFRNQPFLRVSRASTQKWKDFRTCRIDVLRLSIFSSTSSREVSRLEVKQNKPPPRKTEPDSEHCTESNSSLSCFLYKC